MIVEKGKLKNALSKISVFVDKENAGTGSKILFTAKEGKASLMAGDDNGIGVFSFAISEMFDLSFVTNYKALSFASALRGDVNLDFKDDILTIVQGDTSMTFPASAGDTFAFAEKSVEDGGSIKIDSSRFKKLISKVSYARKEKDQRPFVTGVHLTFKDKKLKAESTDALRMLRDFTTIEGFDSVEFKGTLSSKCVKAIELMDEGKEITICMNDKATGFIADDMRIYLPNLNCPYPDANKFFSIDSKAEFTLDKDKVLESMEILSLSENKALLCKKENGKILFSMEDGVADVKDKIDIDSASGDDFEFCLDFEIFRDIFRNLKDSSKVKFSWKDPVSPILFKDEENFEGVTMPLRK